MCRFASVGLIDMGSNASITGVESHRHRVALLLNLQVGYCRRVVTGVAAWAEKEGWLLEEMPATLESRERLVRSRPDGVIAGLSDGKVVIDFGTSLPASTRALGEEVAAAGAQMLSVMLGLGVVSRLVSGMIADWIGGLPPG